MRNFVNCILACASLGPALFLCLACYFFSLCGILSSFIFCLPHLTLDTSNVQNWDTFRD